MSSALETITFIFPPTEGKQSWTKQKQTSNSSCYGLSTDCLHHNSCWDLILHSNNVGGGSLVGGVCGSAGLCFQERTQIMSLWDWIRCCKICRALSSSSSVFSSVLFTQEVISLCIPFSTLLSSKAGRDLQGSPWLSQAEAAIKFGFNI